MSSEEMEISMDFGQHGPAEDIDIDFEFAAAGHPDEDLELGDYNQADEVQHFNSDNRDELMAEDDDASYGMADADDISYNETAAAANDYDIALGDTDVYSWQENEVVIVDEQQIPADQNQDLSGIDDADATFDTAVNDGPELPAQAQSSTLHSIIPEVPEELVHTDQASHNLESTKSIVEGESIQDTATSDGFEVILDKTTQDQVPQGHDTTAGDEDQQGSVELQVKEGNRPEDLYEATQGGAVINDELQGAATAHISSLEEEQDEADHDENTEELEGDDEIGYDDLEGEENTAEDGATATTIAQQASNGLDSVEEHNHLNEGSEAFAGGDADFTTDGFQLGDDSFEQSEGQNDEAIEEPEHHSASPALSNQADLLREVQNDYSSNGTGDAGNLEENMAILADRHVIVVHYGETDYQLFASKPDDDPSEYFFKDLSALELPLGEFLSGIRSVISEEVSPLDELTLHIDGLGLEFGESTAGQFLDTYTFGHILSLYDSLIQNDSANESRGAVDAPELYIYLMLKPNCLQRLKALQVQAASGRSLTDVAVYREASPAEETINVAHSDEVLAVSPDYAVHDLYDEEEQLDDDGYLSEHAEDVDHEPEDADHEPEGADHGPEDADHEPEEDDHETESAELEETHTSPENSKNDNRAEETEGFTGNDNEDTIDYDNLDLTPSQQGKTPYSFSSPIPTHCAGSDGCECDTCWLKRIEEDFISGSQSRNEQSKTHSLDNSTSSDSAQLQGLTGKKGYSYYGTYAEHEPPEANVFHYKDIADQTAGFTTTETSVTIATEDEPTKDASTIPAENSGHEDVPPSESTSATVTLDGDPNDEIDYDENDLDVSRGSAAAKDTAPNPIATLIPPLDEEITWESENEDARNELPKPPKSSEQVSTTPGKRTRSGSDAVELADDRKDVKRQRS